MIDRIVEIKNSYCDKCSQKSDVLKFEEDILDCWGRWDTIEYKLCKNCFSKRIESEEN